jgi:uncharacterized LabA/DUF88 family protein|tara:strand:- start:8506 stop:9072 length:567 start_codon:yes stop_codon:yes gene_type:complete
MKKICVYIDGANFYGGLKSINPKYTDERFDLKRYIKYITKDCLINHIYYYNASLKQQLNKGPFKRQQILFSRLRKIPSCKVILCKRKPRLNTEGKEYHIIKGDDVYLTLDMISDAYEDKYDKAIIISSDGDFTPLIERVRKLNKEVEICYFKDCVSSDLLKSSNKNHLINKKIVKKFFFKENIDTKNK